MPAWRASAALSSETRLCTRTLTASPSASASTVEQHRGAGLEQSARGRQQFGEDHRLELAGRVGEGDEGVGIAGLALALAGVQHRAGKRADRAARACLGSELGPGLGAERFEHVLVIVERVAGEEEADRLELAREPVGRHERLGGRGARSAAGRAWRRRRGPPDLRRSSRSSGCRRRSTDRHWRARWRGRC